MLSKYSTFIHTLVSAVNSYALIRLLEVEYESVFRGSLISQRYGTTESDVDVRVMMVSFCGRIQYDIILLNLLTGWMLVECDTTILVSLMILQYSIICPVAYWQNIIQLILKCNAI